MKFRGYYNQHVAKFLLDVPLEYLMTEISSAIGESRESDIELKLLKELIHHKIPLLRLQIAPYTKYSILNESNAHEIVQELVSQHYLTFSEQKHEQGLYFRVVKQEEVICACQSRSEQLRLTSRLRTVR